jgi:metal-responsive CopG/Arc/MetJ family transcriptional regulator
MYYDGRMKKKVSITIDERLLAEIDRVAGTGERSAVIGNAVANFLRGERRAAIHRQDTALLEEHADALEAVAFDILEYQAQWDESPADDP